MSGVPSPPAAWAAELEAACRLAGAAAEVLRRHYAKGTITEHRKADRSPVTEADLEANAVIVSGLREAFPGDAILSEEEPDNPARLTASRVWLVDPLDGTRDFIARSGDFAVHIALAVDGEPMVAAVAHPPSHRTYTAVKGGGALCRGPEGERTLRVAMGRPFSRWRPGITRTAMHGPLRCFLDRAGFEAEPYPSGASVKALRVAAGELDLTVTLHGRECEWDSCAPGLIVLQAGGRVTDADGQPFRYNQPDVRHLRGVLMTAGEHHDRAVEIARECFPA